jgi:redox-sensitive bicupin YhaK (pirin superfamily)
MLQLRSSAQLDRGDRDWLKAKYHFRVTPEGNPAHGPVGSLVVWNDDEIAPGTGFGFHHHADIEVISYVREGVVTHQDSTGNVGQTAAGDVQVMSAGTGIRHAERNLGPDPLRLFQIWLLPRVRGGTPQWGTRRFPKAERANQLVALASGFTEDEGALPIRADARVLGATVLRGARFDYELRELRHAYVAPARGTLEINGQRLGVGDGVATFDERRLVIVAHEDSELVLVATR